MKKSTLLTTVALSILAGSFSNVVLADQVKKKPHFKVMQHSVAPTGPRNFAAPTGHFPTFAQISGKRATIYLVHHMIGNVTGAYTLKGNPSHKSIKVKIGASCPAGQFVQHLSYDHGGQMIPVYEFNGTGGPSSIIREERVTPWDNNSIAAFARSQMGGNWQGEFPKDERVPMKHTSMTKNIKVISSCSGQNSTKVKTYKIRISQVKIIDTDYD